MGNIPKINGAYQISPVKGRLTNVVAGVNPLDAVNKSQLDAVQQGTVDVTRIELASSGTAAAPAITWDGDTDTGLYRIGTNNIGITANGAKVVDIATTGVTVTGNITATGTILGLRPIVNVSADGAITIPSGDTAYYITKAGVAAMTIANPTATTHDGLKLEFISTTANAHTLSNAAGAGFNGGGAASDIGTYGGAKGDNIVIEAYQGVWYVVSKVNVTLA